MSLARWLPRVTPLFTADWERPLMTGSLGVVVPAFRPDVERLGAYVRALEERIAPEVIRIEFDDPEPGAVDALEGLPATVNAVGRRRGKGAAITAGFEALGTDVLAFVDADGATPCDSVVSVVDPVRTGAVDVAVGSRRHPDAEVRAHQGVVRRLLGDGFAWLARRTLDAKLYDYQCGAKALTATVWDAVRERIYEPGFAWDIELLALAAANGFTIREVPVDWTDIPGSTVDPIRDTLRMFRGLALARHRGKLVTGSRFHRWLARCLPGGPSIVERLGAGDPTAGGVP